jgi:uncharacterized membrane protein
MKNEKKRLKIFSFLGMILSIKLLIILSLLYFPLREYFGTKETVLLVFAMIISLAHFTMSMISSFQYKWGEEQLYTDGVDHSFTL